MKTTAHEPASRLVRWGPVSLAVSTYAVTALYLLTKHLESAYFPTWGRALRRSDLALAVMIAAPLVGLAALSACLLAEREAPRLKRNRAALASVVVWWAVALWAAFPAV